MQVTNNLNQQNFNGTFRIKPSNIKAQQEIQSLFTQGRQIFHDIREKGLSVGHTCLTINFVLISIYELS